MTAYNKQQLKEMMSAMDVRIYNDSLRMERMKKTIQQLKQQLKLVKEVA